MLHNSFHGFREEQGSEMDTLEAHLAQQLAKLAHEPLFQVLFDVWKVYYLLDKGWCLKILRG